MHDQMGRCLAARRRRGQRAARRRGLTLVEIIVVMGLLGALLGIGVGMLSSLDLGRRAAVGVVQNVIRAAHNSAVARGAPARVRMDREARTITAEAMGVVGTWHFETQSIRGAFGVDGVLIGAELVDNGFIGRGVSFVKNPNGSQVEIPIDGEARFDFARGFALDCAVRQERAASGRVISVGGVAGIEISGKGIVRAWLLPTARDQNQEFEGGEPVAIDSPPATVMVGRWHRVHAEYDRRVFRLEVDGREVARQLLEAPVWRAGGAVTIGGGRASFSGTVDNVVVSAVTASDEVELPEGVVFAKQTPERVDFDAAGNLNREVHTEPIGVVLEFEDGEQALVRVGMYGTVE